MADKAKPVKGHYITLGDGRRVTLGQYVDAWKMVKSLPPDTRVRGSPTAYFRDAPNRAGDAVQEFRAGIDDRINSKDPRYGKGRKWDSQWQAEARHLRDVLDRKSEIPRGQAHPVDLRPRIAHRVEGGVPASPPGGTKRFTAPAVVERNLDRIERLGYERFREAARSLGVSVEGGNTQIRENIRRYVAGGFGEGGRLLAHEADYRERQAKMAARAELRSLVDKTGAPQSVKDRAVKAGMAEHDRVDRALMKTSRPTPQVPAMKGMTPMGAKSAESTKASKALDAALRKNARFDRLATTPEMKGLSGPDLRKFLQGRAEQAYRDRYAVNPETAEQVSKSAAKLFKLDDPLAKPAPGPAVKMEPKPNVPRSARASIKDQRRGFGEAYDAAEKRAASTAALRDELLGSKSKRTVSIKYGSAPGALTQSQKDAMVKKGGPAPGFKSPKTDAPVKVADAVPHKGTKIPAAPKAPKGTYKEALAASTVEKRIAVKNAALARVESAISRAEKAGVKISPDRIAEARNPTTAMMVASNADDFDRHVNRKIKTASKRSPAKTSASAPAAPHAAEKAVRATERREAAVVNKQMTEPKAPTAAAETAKPVRLTPYQQSLQAPPRQLSHARDHTGALDPLYTSKSRRQLVEEGVKKGIGTRSELRALQPEALAKRLKYRGLAGLAVAVVAGGAAALMTRSSTAVAAPADSGKTRTDPYTDSLGRNYANGRLIVRQQ